MGALRDLATNDDNKAEIAAAGAIPPLVALLGAQSAAATQEAAAWALRDLSFNADYQAEVSCLRRNPPPCGFAGCTEHCYCAACGSGDTLCPCQQR